MLRLDVIRQLGALLAEQAVLRADKVAFADPVRGVTYGELARRTGNLAGALRNLGVGDGDRVAIYMTNGVSVIESYLAIARAGAVGVCLTAQATRHEAEFMLADSQALVVLCDDEHVDAVLQASASLPAIRQVIVDGAPRAETAGFADLAEQPASQEGLDRLPLDSPAWMLYTSGTTGRPKGVLLSQRGMLWVVAACWLQALGMSADDYVLCPLPLSHSYPLDGSLAVIASGARMFIQPRFSPSEALRVLRSEPVTAMWGVPTIYATLLSALEKERQEVAPDRPASPWTPSLRFCLSAGAILSADIARRFEESTGVPVVDIYGATETSTVITANAFDRPRVLGSCGVPIPGLAVRIVDPLTGGDCPPGRDGELIARGPSIMLGYHNRPAETAQTLRDGWYHSGDLARFDANGFVTITGRVKEMIIRGGENVAPMEIEEVVLAHPGVLDCAAAGRPDGRLGEVPVLFVVPAAVQAEFDVGALLTHCREHLSAFKVPAEVHLVDRIPRTASGKIQRFKLLERLQPPAEVGAGV